MGNDLNRLKVYEVNHFFFSVFNYAPTLTRSNSKGNKSFHNEGKMCMFCNPQMWPDLL